MVVIFDFVAMQDYIKFSCAVFRLSSEALHLTNIVAGLKARNGKPKLHVFLVIQLTSQFVSICIIKKFLI